MAKFSYAMNWHWLLFFNNTYLTWTVARRHVGPETSLRRNAILGLFGTHVSKFVYITPTIIGLLHFEEKTFLKRFQKQTFRFNFVGNLRLRNLVLHSELLLREKLCIFLQKEIWWVKDAPNRLKVQIWQQMNSACLISNWQLASMPCCAHGSSKSTSKKSREATMTKAAFWGSVLEQFHQPQNATRNKWQRGLVLYKKST